MSETSVLKFTNLASIGTVGWATMNLTSSVVDRSLLKFPGGIR